jgi:hypothetical protein
LIYDRTIPVTDAGENDPQYRLTESLSSYLYCRVRSRNKNLFTANQVIKSTRIHLIKNWIFFITRDCKVTQLFIHDKILLVHDMVMNVRKNGIIIHIGNPMIGS